MQLSILDLSPLVSQAGGTGEALRNTLELAQRGESLGYTRHWLAEHHNMPGIASVAPEVLIGHVASVTKRIRVGSGGIMLPNHSALKVAETFKTLEALHPGRIDLGLGRAPGTDGRTAQALRGGLSNLAGHDFPEQLDELFAFAGDGFPPGHPFSTVQAVPTDVKLPPIWLLGSSDFSARLAAQLGLGFAYAHHIHPHAAVESMQVYRRDFRPSRYLSEPQSILTVNAICADTSETATALGNIVDLAWIRFLRRQSAPLPSVEEAGAYRFSADERDALKDRHASLFLGTPDDVSSRVQALARETQADEVMITTMLPQQARLRSYELLAYAFSLAAVGAS
jgi:luciferase family oxidoreductase group 1